MINATVNGAGGATVSALILHRSELPRNQTGVRLSLGWQLYYYNKILETSIVKAYSRVFGIHRKRRF